MLYYMDDFRNTNVKSLTGHTYVIMGHLRGFNGT
jgi:hypothetical protein